jgi:hypothetical protein
MDLICPSCQKRLTIEDGHAGLVVRCPMCNGMFQAPALPPVTTPAPAPTPSVSTAPNTAIAPTPEKHVTPTPVLLSSPPEAQPATPENYTRTFTILLLPDVVAWVNPVCLTLIFVLSLFPWYFREEYTLNLWQLAFTERGFASSTLYTLVVIFLAWPLSIAVLGWEQGWIPNLPALEPYWRWRAALVGLLTLVPFLFFLSDYIWCQFRVFGNPTLFAMKLAFRLHFVAVVGSALAFWLEVRKWDQLTYPKVDVRW